MESIPTAFEKKEIYTNGDEQIHNSAYDSNILYLFVLAGGLGEDGKNHIFVEKRLDTAIELYAKTDKKCKIICMGGGTYHKPPHLNHNNYVIHESTSCAQYLHSKGVPQNDIYREWTSHDTIANGFFAYINFIIPLNINDAILITSEFHMHRSCEIFSYFINMSGNSVHMEYMSSPNDGIDGDTLKERKEREQNSLLYFKENVVNKLKTLEEFTIWFYTHHNAYKSIIEYKKMDSVTSATY